MGMTATTAPAVAMSRSGQANSAGSSTALFLKVYAGEVLTAFEQASVTMDKHVIRSINSGISAQFPMVWKTGTPDYAYINAASGTPGTQTVANELSGMHINKAEKVISIDGLLIADHFVNNLDEAMNHYDVRSIYAKEAGIALGTQWDKNVLQQGVKGARLATPVLTGSNLGSVLTESTFASSGTKLAEAMFDGAQKMDENNVPENDRYMFVKPAKYYLMAETTNVINRDWGGSGTYSEGSVLKVAGIHIVKTNNLPTTNITTGADAHKDNFSTTVGLIMHKSAVATVKLLNLAVETEYDIKQQGWWIVAKYAMGHGYIRPEACIELRTAAP